MHPLLPVLERIAKALEAQVPSVYVGATPHHGPSAAFTAPTNAEFLVAGLSDRFVAGLSDRLKENVYGDHKKRLHDSLDTLLKGYPDDVLARVTVSIGIARDGKPAEKSKPLSLHDLFQRHAASLPEALGPDAVVSRLVSESASRVRSLDHKAKIMEAGKIITEALRIELRANPVSLLDGLS